MISRESLMGDAMDKETLNKIFDEELEKEEDQKCSVD